MITKKKVLTGIAGVLLVAATAGYGAAAYYYSSHFYSHTEINGTDYGEMTVAQVKKKIADQIPSYQITIEERNGQEETLTGEQLKLTYQDDGEIDKLMEDQRPWAWVIHAFTGVHVQLENMVAVNEEALKQAVEGLTCMQPGNMQAPKDAYVGITDDGYAVIPEEEGTTLDEGKVTAGLHQALTNGEITFDLDAGDCYVKPEIMQDDAELKAKADAINQKLSANLTMDFGTDRKEVLDKNTLKDWVAEAEDGSFSIDEEKVKEYVVGLAKKYDTVNSKRTFTTTAGNTVTLTPGDYGWEIDQSGTESNLMQAINDGTQGGFRFPQLDVPVATYCSGTKKNDQDSCCVYFSEEKLKKLYPTRRDYIDKIFKAIDVLEEQRFFSVEDADQMKLDILKLPVPCRDHSSKFEE